ncbi:MAG TPA: tRNA (adenosine(37)-N6)-dimethylallyltransferase MiaA [Desulfobacteria bacterium]|nr:tRNA (adenosine(37)-N6)-dimethylallyltransferase MiaA [Desulfobacteria bacterium]
MKQALAVIVGPTAVGKSDIAVQVAKQVNGEIISGDSVQVYRGLDIGSAKVTPAEQQGIPHYMLDILDPDENFSVAMFQDQVRRLIREINERGKLPILVGGTGLYIRSVLDPYEFPAMQADKAIRTELQTIAREHGSAVLHQRLAAVDPESARRIHINDLNRIVRALEVYKLTGRPFSVYRNLPEAAAPADNPYNLTFIGLTGPRPELYARIERRVDLMLAKGLVNEVKVLLAAGYHPSVQALQAIGYRHVVQYLRGLLTKPEMTRLLKRDTRHFAKRQLTWFRRDRRIIWFDSITRPQREIVQEVVERICATCQDGVK